MDYLPYPPKVVLHFIPHGVRYRVLVRYAILTLLLHTRPYESDAAGA